MNNKKKNFRPPAFLEEAYNGPSYVRWLMLAGGAALLHAAVAAFIGLEADSSWEVLLMSMVGAFIIGMFLAVSGYNGAVAFAAAGGPPAVFAKWHWYWKADMHSPAGAAQGLVTWLFKWDPPPPAHYALAIILGGTALVAWFAAWINLLWEKKTGAPLM